MKKALSLFLVILMIAGIFNCVSVSASAQRPSLKNVEIYKAQALLGIAYDEKSNAVQQCNGIYNYYVRDELFSPSQNYLDICYNDKQLMLDYASWKAYTLAAKPSELFGEVVQKEDYYTSLIVSMYTQATIENDAFKEFIDDQTVQNTNDFVQSLCDAANVLELSNLFDKDTFISNGGLQCINESVSENFAPASVGKISGALGSIIEASNSVYDIAQRIALYKTMTQLDEITKLWLFQLRDQCVNTGADIALITAANNLCSACTNYAGEALAGITKATFSFTDFAFDKLYAAGIGILTSSNPIAQAVFAGLTAGRTISNILFAADDVCEQFCLMECIFEIERVSRNVISECKTTFLEKQTFENAKAFLNAVDCYFEAIINLDINCMEEFLTRWYRGGIIHYNQKEYNEHIDTLEGLKTVRTENYNKMVNYYKAALKLNYPDEYEEIFGSTVRLKSISMALTKNLPIGYPAGYADILEGDTSPIDISFFPENTTQTGYRIVSSDPSVLRVEGDNVVAVSAGTAMLIVSSTANPNIYDARKIKVGKINSEHEIIETPEEYFTYTVSNDEVTITGLVSGCTLTEVNIPHTIQGMRVTEIGNRAFRNNSNLRSITIPDSVTYIGYNAFEDCSGLTSVTIGNSVTNIGDFAFYGCSGIKELTMPASAKIYKSAFSYTFKNCTNIEKVTLTKGMGTMQNYGTSSTYEYTPWYISRDSIKDIVIEDGVENIGIYAFYGCSSLTSVTIPNSVTSIGYCAFYGCSSLTSITIPNSVTSIGGCTFEGCSSLTSITIPDSVTSIDRNAFDGCSSLISITIPDSVTSIGDDAFSGCKSLTGITIPDSVTSIGWSAFSGCSGLKELTMPVSVLLCSFKECISLERVTLTKGTGTMPDFTGIHPSYKYTPWYVRGADLKELVLEEGITNIGKNAFLDCSGLASIIIPNSITSIGEDAFRGCSGLTSITIPNSVTSIGSYAFYGCSGLTSVNIPNSVTSIGVSAFSKCTGLTSVAISNSVTSIGDDSFSGCSSLTSITIPNSVTSIGENAFCGCSGLTSITIPDSVTSIEWGAFGSCSGLTSVVIPDSVTSIGSNAFAHCSSLTSVNIPNSVTRLSGWMFCDCSSLKSITIPDSITSIGYGAFGSCSELENIYYTGTRNQWDNIDIDSYNDALSTDKIHFNYDPNHNHSYTAVVTAPTCTEQGYTTHTCSCGDSYVDSYINALGHDFSNNAEYCRRCCTTKNPNYVAPVHTHSYGEWAVTKAATCTQAGVKTAYCSCGEQKTEAIPALGHNASRKAVVKPTGTKLGYTDYKCSNCGAFQKRGNYTAPTGRLALKHSARTVNALKVQWNNVKTATGYQVQISTKDGKKWSTYATLKAGISAYTFKKLAAGNNYKFHVRFYIKSPEGNKFSPWSTTLSSPTLPAGTAFTKLTPAKRAFVAQWKKQAVTGYQVQYGLKANFAGAKTITLKNPKLLKAAASKLYAGKYYFVRIRTYKTIAKANYFSTWSKTYKVKTK